MRVVGGYQSQNNSSLYRNIYYFFISNRTDFTKAVKMAAMPVSGRAKAQDCRFCSKILVYIAIETLLPWMLPKTLLYPSFCTWLLTSVYDRAIQYTARGPGPAREGLWNGPRRYTGSGTCIEICQYWIMNIISPIKICIHNEITLTILIERAVPFVICNILVIVVYQ